MTKTPSVWAIVPAAGAGRRMEAGLPKQYLQLNGKTLLQHTLSRVLDYPGLSGVVVVVAPGDRRVNDVANAFKESRLEVVTGGVERCHSVLNGLHALAARAAEHDWIMVHDAARPCVSLRDLDRLFAAIRDEPAGGLLGMPVRDTMKRAGADSHVMETVDRERLWHALTPQVFRFQMLLEALEGAIQAGVSVTDEAAAMERAGHRPLMVEGRADNIKVTRPEDLDLAAFYLRQQEGE